MSLRRGSAVLLGCLLWVSGIQGVAAGDAAVPDTKKLRGYHLEILLDPAADAALRAEELSRLRAAAMAGKPAAQAVLGSLYRLGPEHPARLLPRDDAEAETYLSNAAAGGAVMAMAGMAELELRRKQSREALVWAQIHAHYSPLQYREPQSAKAASEYQAYLLSRCFDAAGKDVDMVRLQADLDAFTAAYDQRIRRAIEAGPPAPEDGGNERLRYAAGSWGGNRFQGSIMTPSPSSPAQVIYLAGVAGDGRIERLLVIDALPDARAAARLQAWVIEQGRFNAAETGGRLRWGQLPMSFANGAFGFKSPAP